MPSISLLIINRLDPEIYIRLHYNKKLDLIIVVYSNVKHFSFRHKLQRRQQQQNT